MGSAKAALLVNLQQEPMTSLAVFTLPLRWRCSVALQEVGLKVKAFSGAPVEGSQGSGEDSVAAGPFEPSLRGRWLRSGHPPGVLPGS